MGIIFNDNKPTKQQSKTAIISRIMLAAAIFLVLVGVLLFSAANKGNDNAAVGTFFIIVGVLLSLPYIRGRKKALTEKPINEPQVQPKALAFDNVLSRIPLAPISINHMYIKTNYVKEMPNVDFSIPVKGGNYGDFVVIDTETTGISITNEIIDLSAIKYMNYKPIAAFTTLIKPKMIIPAEVVELTHITNDMVADSPTIYQVMPSFIEFVGDNDIIGHNLLFDLKFVYKYGFKFHDKSRRYFDTLEIARNTVRGTQDFKLTTLCAYFGIVRNDAHRSLSDCLATAMVYMRMLNSQ